MLLRSFPFSWFLNVDGAAFWLLLHRCQVTLLTVDNEAQCRFVLSKPCALCGVEFLSVCLYDSPQQIRWVSGCLCESGDTPWFSLYLYFPRSMERGVASPGFPLISRIKKKKKELGRGQIWDFTQEPVLHVLTWS